MPTNLFFQNYTNTMEQTLLEDLICESIRIYGSDCFYIPRQETHFDPLFTEDAQSTYSSAYMIELYLKNVMGFAGDKEFMSKLSGVEIRDQIVLTMARRTFYDLIGHQLSFQRPREGDIIWFPINKRAFIIRYVENFEMLYQLGALQTWELTCELFEYSSEKIATGIADFDALQTQHSFNVFDYAVYTENFLYYLTDENGTILCDENFYSDRIDPIADNEHLDKLTLDLDLINWAETDPFSEGVL